MKKNDPTERPRSRANRSSKAVRYFLVAAIFAMGIAGFIYWPQFAQKLADRQLQNSSGRIGVPPPPVAETATQAPSRPVQPSLDAPPQVPVTAGNPADDSNSSSAGDSSPATGNPEQLVNELNAFYAHLDQEPYMQDFALKETSREHFSKLLQKLIDNPPVVIRETDDILTLLKNTAHFYRILDKDNIVILKGILDRDRDSFEQILKTFYALTYHPEFLKQEYSLTLPLEALNDYATFFLNTIGGKLYLFRRDSASRMTVSYYAIQVIDRANREGNNQLGIDLRPSIDSLIEEMENSGKNLKFRNEYLENLYDLKEKYN